MKVLALDTATECCSVALSVGARIIERCRELDRGHAEHILAMVDEVLAEAGLALPELQALAFGRGPGAFTGARLAASVTQGLGFGARLGVVPVSDLAAVAQRAMEQESGAERVLVCTDARMREVYWGAYERAQDSGLATLRGSERVGSAKQVALPEEWGTAPAVGAGTGFAAFPELRGILHGAAMATAAGGRPLLPRAREILTLALPAVRAGRLVSAEEAIPTYLRDDVARLAGS